MKITLKASEVSAIIGLNPYKHRKEVLDELWKKYSPSTFTGKTKKDRAVDTIQASLTATGIMNSVSKIKAKDSTEVQNIVADARKHIDADTSLNEEQKTDVISHITSVVYTSHGTRSEDKTANKVATETGARLVRDNSFYNLDVTTINGNEFVVCGKIDRIEECEDGSRVLVEIKNRANRLFHRVVEYEMVQVQVYLQMLGLERALLVEQYNDQVLSHNIDRDDEFWENVAVPGLNAFCEEFSECIDTRL